MTATYAATVQVIPSRSGGPDHLVTVIDSGPLAGKTLCTCKAGQRGIVCWAQRLALVPVTPAPQDPRDIEDIAAAIGNVAPHRPSVPAPCMSQTERDAEAAWPSRRA